MYKIDDVVEFVKRKHKDQKYGDKPYIYHLLKVKEVCDKYINLYQWSDYDKYVIQICALCHDILEDTDTTDDEMINLFGYDIHKIVFNLTGVGQNRKERNENAYNKIIKDRRSIFIKLCDRISNVTESITNRRKFDMYKKEYDNFRNHIYNGQFLEMWNELDELLN